MPPPQNDKNVIFRFILIMLLAGGLTAGLIAVLAWAWPSLPSWAAGGGGCLVVSAPLVWFWFRCVNQKAVAGQIAPTLRSNQQMRALLRAIPDELLCIDSHGLCRNLLLDSPAGQSGGQKLEEVWPEKAARALESAVAAVLASGQPQECLLERPTGEALRKFEARCIPFTPDGVLAMVRDISERVHAEQTLREKDELLQTLLNALPDFISVRDEAGRWLLANPVALALFDLTDKPYHNCTTQELMKLVPEYWNALEVVRATDEHCWEMGEPYRLEERITKPDGSVVIFDVIKIPIFDDQGRRLRLVVLGHDVTVRFQSEEALRQNERRYRRLFEFAPIGILITAPDGHIIDINPALCEMLQYTVEELRNRPVADLAQNSEVIPENIRRILMGETMQHEVIDCRRDGQLVSLELRETRLDLPDGRPGILTIAIDVTEKRRLDAERLGLENRIQQTQKLESLGVLAGGIAHDFNNLLTGMLGYSTLAKTQLIPESPVRQMLTQIETAAQRAAELCNQMLAYSGRGRFVIQPVDLSALVEEMLQMLEVSISKKAILRLNMARHLPMVEADATQLRQVIMNLITNASDAIGERSGVIVLSTGLLQVDRHYLLGATIADGELEEGVYIYLEVSDTGCGMDEATRRRIFDPFYTTKFMGRGLGLAAVLGIVRSHMGVIKVYSEPGRGSTFKVMFPASIKNALERETKTESSMQWRGAGRILVIDDEETVRVLTRQLLELTGFTVMTAMDGREGVDLFAAENGEFDLVLLDLTMPHLGGEEAFREMRRIDPQVRVLLTSGYSEHDVINLFAGKGLAGFIQKPFKSSDLIAKVRSILESDADANSDGDPTL
jgi:PAS domain S-box-containing protein